MDYIKEFHYAQMFVYYAVPNIMEKSSYLKEIASIVKYLNLRMDDITFDMPEPNLVFEKMEPDFKTKDGRYEFACYGDKYLRVDIHDTVNDTHFDEDTWFVFHPKPYLTRPV